MNRIQARKTIQACASWSANVGRADSRQRKFASAAAAVIVAYKASQGQYFNLKVSA
jgi:hypothetical protein